MTTVDRTKLESLHHREESRFLADHPKSAALYARAQSSLLGGVPMNWMKKWAGAFPIFVKSAKGAHFTDVDGREYIDLCLGDTGAMTGHSPEIVAKTVARRAKEGITFMLPTEDSLRVGEDLQRRFRLSYWQFTLTATDANRFAIRIAREITQRSKILVFHYCYHGTVDESFATLENGVVGPRRGNIGPPANSRAVTARSSSPLKPTPFAPAPAAAPPNGNSIPTCSSSARPLAAAFPARPTAVPRKSPSTSTPAFISKTATSAA